jgi:hypothetical protein
MCDSWSVATRLHNCRIKPDHQIQVSTLISCHRNPDTWQVGVSRTYTRYTGIRKTWRKGITDPKHVTIICTHLSLGLHSGHFLLTFPPISYTHSFSLHSCYMPYPAHPPWLVYFNYTWRRVEVKEAPHFVWRTLHFLTTYGKSARNRIARSLWATYLVRSIEIFNPLLYF